MLSLVASVAPTIIPLSTNDTELLQLCRQFEPLYARWLELEPHRVAWQKQISATLEARSTATARRIAAGERVESYNEAYQAAYNLFADPEIEAALDDLLDPMGEITDAIFEASPATLTECAIKARAAHYRTRMDGFCPSTGLFIVEDAIAGLCRLAGVPIPGQPWPTAPNPAAPMMAVLPNLAA